MSKHQLADRTTQDDLEWWFAKVDELEWIWAKTYAQSAPHDYVVLGRSADMTRDIPELDRYTRTITLLRRTLHLVLLGDTA